MPNRNYHDIGGLPAGPVTRDEPPWQHWEKEVEAIRNLLGDGNRRLVSLDEMRRGFETFGESLYASLGFYERRLEAMLRILEEKGVVARDEVERRVAAHD